MQATAALALTLTCTCAFGATAQSETAPIAVVSDEEFEFFKHERETCLKALPYDRIEMRLRYIGWRSTPDYKWSLDADGTLTFVDFSKVGKGDAGGSDSDGEAITLKVTCFATAEIQSLAKALIEQSPERQNCAIFSDHAEFGQVVLKINGSEAVRDFSLGCTDLQNPGFNAAIRAMNDRVTELVNHERMATSESD